MPAEEILPNLYRVVVPLPGNPLKEVNSYVLTGGDRNLIIDTGMNRPECQQALDAGLAEIGVDLERTDFVATHLHADHQGLIASLLRPGAKAYMGEADAAAMQLGFDPRSQNSPIGEYAARSGFPTHELLASLQNHPGFKYGAATVVDYVPLRDGETFTTGAYRLETITTPGHTDGHICLYDPQRKILFSGDHVLGDITPNIQAWSDDRDPLHLYLTSLEQVGTLEVELCLPGHRTVVADLEARVAELIEHHRARANEVLEILEDGARTAYRTAAEMSWDIKADSWEDFPIMQKWFATGEAIAHLRYLEGKGLAWRELRNGHFVYCSNPGSRL